MNLKQSIENVRKQVLWSGVRDALTDRQSKELHRRLTSHRPFWDMVLECAFSAAMGSGLVAIAGPGGIISAPLAYQIHENSKKYGSFTGWVAAEWRSIVPEFMSSALDKPSNVVKANYPAANEWLTKLKDVVLLPSDVVVAESAPAVVEVKEKPLSISKTPRRSKKPG